MLRMHYVPMFKNRIMTAHMEARCGVLMWTFCTVEEGERIIETGIRDKQWGYRETLPLREELQTRLPKDTKEMAERLRRFEPTSAAVHVDTRMVLGSLPSTMLFMGNAPLHQFALPSLGLAVDALETHYQKGRISAGDGIAAVRTLLEQNMPDTISDPLFFYLAYEETRRDLVTELACRMAMGRL